MNIPTLNIAESLEAFAFRGCNGEPDFARLTDSSVYEADGTLKRVRSVTCSGIVGGVGIKKFCSFLKTYKISFKYKNFWTFGKWKNGCFITVAESRSQAIDAAKQTASQQGYGPKIKNFKASKMMPEKFKPEDKATYTIAGDLCEAQGQPRTRSNIQQRYYDLLERKTL